MKKKKKKRKKRRPATHTLSPDVLKDLGIPEDRVIKVDLGYKISEVFSDFARDFLEGAISDEDYIESVFFAAMAWNIGLLPEKDQEAQLQKLIERYDRKKTAEDIARILIRRKVEYFDEYKNFIVDTNVVFKGNDKVDLTIHSLLGK